jgi:hypothetical protein
MKIDGRCHCGYVTFEAEAEFRNSTGRGIDLGLMRCELVCAQRSPAVAEVCAILSVGSTGVLVK